MECPRCGRSWDGKELTCTQCGFSRGRLQGLGPRPISSELRPTGPSPLRARSQRLVSGSLEQQLSHMRAESVLSQASAPAEPAFPAQSAYPLRPGTVLQRGHYRLHELQEWQQWINGVFEATWLAQDALQKETFVTIREVAIPESRSDEREAILRQATRTFMELGAHPALPILKDTFIDQGRIFLVFECVEGESLLKRLHTQKHFLAETEVIEICRSVCDVLDVLARQKPPIVHGLIDPRHIVIGHGEAPYLLTNTSILLAAQATRWVTGTERARLSPYAAPELVSGHIDVRADLYSLLATVSHLVRGSIPPRIPATHQSNSPISPAFAALLFKGLHPLPGQRYQTPAELSQALLDISTLEESIENKGPEAARGLPLEAFIRSASQSQDMSSVMRMPAGEEEHHKLLPRPEDLPAVPEKPDLRNAVLWMTSILLLLCAVIWLAQGVF